MRIITQRDIAAEAKVSQALVSLVLAESKEGATYQSRVRVSQETRQAILDAANRLGYQNKIGGRRAAPTKSLLYVRRLEGEPIPSGKTQEDFLEEARQQVLQNALIEAVSRQGFTLAVRLYIQPEEVLSSGICDSLDGVFLGKADRELIEFFSPKLPVITLKERPLIASDVVVADDHDLIDRAMECLRRHGHTRIALITAHPESKMGARRNAAFVELSERFGIDACPLYSGYSNPVDFFDRFLDPLQATDLRPTALIAEEALALSIQNEASRRGLSLPDDLSIVGLGHSAASAFSSPLLTTVSVAPGEIAQVALSLMTDRLETWGTKSGHRKIEVAASLMDGASVSGPGPSSDMPEQIPIKRQKASPGSKRSDLQS